MMGAPQLYMQCFDDVSVVEQKKKIRKEIQSISKVGKFISRLRVVCRCGWVCRRIHFVNVYIAGERTCIAELGTGKFMVNCSNMLVEDGKRLLVALMSWC